MTQEIPIMFSELYFLGAGKPASGDRPAALKNIVNNTRAIDWQLNSFSDVVREKDIYFLGGYHVNEVVDLYPSLNFTVAREWQSKKALHTLLHAPLSGDSAFVTYSDTLFRKNFIDRLPQTGDSVLVVVDSLWKGRFRDRSSEDIKNAETVICSGTEMEFTGLTYLTSQAIDILREIQSSQDLESVGSTFQDFFIFLESRGVKIQYIDVFGDWAEFNSTQDITKFILGTKADTLSRLENIVSASVIGAQVSFVIDEWRSNPQPIVSNIQRQFKNTRLVVRSSSAAEDNWMSSNAGGFESVLDVSSSDERELIAAIDTVVNSYGVFADSKDQVLIQELLQDAAMSGVVFTCSIENGAPYYRFNFDDSSNSTDSVTSGSKAELRTVILNKRRSETLVKIAPELCNVLAAIQEIEGLLNFDKLDIEFAVDSKSRVHIFQVRPIVVNHDSYDIDPTQVEGSLLDSVERFQQLQLASPQISGKRTLFANMPDWNPAEIIGVKPKPLAFSLYQHLITNDVWARQRKEFGYRDVAPAPLIYGFSGQPYVDVRASFNSFLPRGMPKDCCERIIDAYIRILDENRQYHDKIEFNVAFSAWFPGFASVAKARLCPYGVFESDIKILEELLIKITSQALVRLDSDIASLGPLIEKRAAVVQSDLSSFDKAYCLLWDCKELGTLAFSHAARAGFVAKILLNALVDAGSMKKVRVIEFFNSFQTVTGLFDADKRLFLEGEITREALIERYGHLRPGTYEVTASAYWEDPEIYLIPTDKHDSKADVKEFIFCDEEIAGISRLLDEMGSVITPSEFIQYLIEATQKRESVKFEFTKNLSKALDCIVEFSHEKGISREDSSYLTFADLHGVKLGLVDIGELKKNIVTRRNAHKMTKVIELPAVISSVDDFFCFERHAMLPNFIGADSVIADVKTTRDLVDELEGKIVVVSQADPGFDWLFSHNLAGLITQYGGANSHMAIRCAEIGLPAAIGVGQKLYEELVQASRVELDCLGQRVRVIS